MHSHEVSSVAEDMAAQLTRGVLSTDLQGGKHAAVPLVAATCGLIHDIGNPPFGHAGELAISTWFEDKRKDGIFKPFSSPSDQRVMDFLTFEGNAQGIRIASNVFLLADYHGLNYTSATLSASCKYLAKSNEADKNNSNHAYTKPGWFVSEEEVVGLARGTTGTVGVRHPITYIVEAADDIVYCNVDLEDGVKKKLLSWPRAEEYLAERSTLAKESIDKARKMLEHSGLAERAFDEAMAAAFRISSISLLVKNAAETFTRRYDEIMRGEYLPELVLDQDSVTRDFVDASKAYLRTTLYRTSDILRLEVRGRRVVHDLMDAFWEGAKCYDGNVTTKTYAGKLYLLISDNYRKTFEHSFDRARSDAERHYCRLQLVTDQVAGMTDSFACRLHKDLFNG